jgi:hypothetical protein
MTIVSAPSFLASDRIHVLEIEKQRKNVSELKVKVNYCIEKKQDFSDFGNARKQLLSPS